MKDEPNTTTPCLEWRQPKTFADWYELHSEDQVLGTLTFPSLLSTLATAETVVGSWTLEEAGILDQRVLVRDAGSGLELAVFYPNLMGDGTVELRDGRRLRWEATNFWATNWRFVDELGNEPVSLRSGRASARLRDLLKNEATLEVMDNSHSGWDASEILLLAAMGWYLMIRRQQKTVVVATAA